MRIRAIKPEFWSDARTGEWNAQLALFYVGIWQSADDSGRLRLDPRLIRSELDPFDAKFGGADGVAELLEQLVRLGRILPYEVEGQRYGVVAKFAEHQVINRPTKSRLPEPPRGLRAPSVSPPGALTRNDVVEGKGRDQGSGSEGSGSEGSGRERGAVADAPAPAPASPVVYALRCSGRGPKTYDVTQAQLDEWAAAFPGIDVLGEVRKSASWQDANPSRRKTHRGMASHLVSWLGRAQDSAQGPRNGAPVRTGAPVPAKADSEFSGSSGGFGS